MYRRRSQPGELNHDPATQDLLASVIRFYFKKGKWHVTSDKKPVPATLWWAAINQVKCMNHKLRQQQRAQH